MYFGEGKQTKEGYRAETLIHDDQPGRVTVTTNDYLNYYIGFRISPGFSAKGETVRFMIYRDWSHGAKKIPDTLQYEPCPVLHYTGDEAVTRYNEFCIDKQAFRSLTKRERDRFFNNIRDRYSQNVSWCTLNFMDGMGIQYIGSNPDTGIYGSLDAAKQVVNQTATVEKHWFHYDLITMDGQPAVL